MNESAGENVMMMPSSNSAIKFPNYFGQPPSLPSNTANQSDELVDLNNLFGKLKLGQLHTQEYLESFTHVALFWDPRHASAQLEVKNPDFDARIVTSLTSLNSFKSVYSQEPLVQGQRYYFEIKFLKGCNFKIGVCKNKTVKENAFCDETDGYGYYSAGQLRNGSKTSGMKYGETYRGNKD